MFNSKKEEGLVKQGRQVPIDTILGQETIVDGTMTTRETVRIDGLLKGEIHSEGSLIIGETGEVKGNIYACNLLTAGCIYGNVKVEERMEVTSTGKIIGDIVTKTLIIDEGAAFKGNCIMESMIEKEAAETAEPEEVMSDYAQEETAEA